MLKGKCGLIVIEEGSKEHRRKDDNIPDASFYRGAGLRYATPHVRGRSRSCSQGNHCGGLIRESVSEAEALLFLLLLLLLFLLLFLLLLLLFAHEFQSLHPQLQFKYFARLGNES